MADPNTGIRVPAPPKTPLTSPTGPTGQWSPFELRKSEIQSPAEMMEEKPSRFSQVKMSTPYNYWKKATVNPIGSAAAAASIAGLATYFGAPWLLRKLHDRLPEQMRPDMSEEELQKTRRRLALLAFLGFGASSVLTHYDKRSPWASMTNWNYGPKGSAVKLQQDLASGGMFKPAALRKTAMFADFSNPAVMAQDIIPMDHAKEIVANDRYLTSGQKAAITTIFDNTPDKDGIASMTDLTSGAIRAGLGFAGGAVAGYALGKLFALPPSITRAASITGGLANALRASGLIS